MTRARSVKEVLRAVGSSYLSLYKGEGYWYFIYDNGCLEALVYESFTVYAMRLNDMTRDAWVERGRDFVTGVEAGTWDRMAH